MQLVIQWRQIFMTFTANILINLCLIFAIYRLNKKPTKLVMPVKEHNWHILDKKTKGQVEKFIITAKIAEKTADRAFQMASQASLSCVALQKSLAMPRLLTKNQINQNKLAKKQVDDILGENDMFSWMRPTLSDEENELLDDVLKEKEKRELNGDGGEKLA